MFKMDILLPTAIQLDIRRSKISFRGENSPLLNSFTVKKLNEHYTNGLSRYVEKIRFEVITEISECKRIWEMFSSNESLFDLWEFRMFFHKAHRQTPYFLALKKNDRVLASLPLCYQESEGYYTWFGTDWQEDCHFFSLDPNYIPILLYFAPKPLSLSGISKEDKISLPEFVEIGVDEPNFYLDLTDKRSLDDYFLTLNKKKRYNLRRDLKHINALNPKLVFDGKKSFDGMVEITSRRFHNKGEKTDFDKDPSMIESFRRMVHNSKKTFSTSTLAVNIKNQFAGVDILAFYKDVYYSLRGGNDTENFPGIGNFLNLVEINEAILKGMREINFLQYDYGWKSSWFQKRARFKYEATL